MEIIRIGVESIDTLQALSIETFKDTFGAENSEVDMEKYVKENLSREVLTAEIENTDSYFFMGVIDGTPVGYLKLNKGDAQTEKQGVESIEIERIYVRKPWIGKGIGGLLIDYAVNFAVQNHFPRLWLGVWERNERAIKFYEKKGFNSFADHIFTLGNDAQRDVLMELKLK